MMISFYLGVHFTQLCTLSTYPLYQFIHFTEFIHFTKLLTLSVYLFYSFFNKVKSEFEIENVYTLNIKIGDPPWKRLYIPLSFNKSLLELQKKIDKKFRKYRNYKFDPHLSLAYGNFTPDKKDISLISNQEMISFSSIAIVNTPNEIKNWDIIQKFDSV